MLDLQKSYKVDTKSACHHTSLIVTSNVPTYICQKGEINNTIN